MEETISGGRKEKNARPSINSYMYGNANALANLYILKTGGLKSDKVTYYFEKARDIRYRTLSFLYDFEGNFFQVKKEQGDTLANVKEEVGFLPWYFNMFSDLDEDTVFFSCLEMADG